MKHCDKCNVNIAGNRKVCPLCQRVLTEEILGYESMIPDEEIFPNIPTLYKQHSLFFKILIFLSIVIVVITITIDIMFHKYNGWSLFVVAGVGCLWMELYVAFYKRKNIPNNILHQTVLVSGLCVFWDWFVGWYGWSLDFAVPIVFISALLAMVLLGKIMHLDVEDYTIYVIIGAIFGFIPIIFLATNLVKSPYMSLVSVASSIIFLSGVIIFQGTKIASELRRRLHL